MTGDTLSDSQLMQRLAQDDTLAFDILFLRHRQAVFNYTHRMTAECTLAEDITQECFLRVWRARHTYQATAPLCTWLLTIARRLVLDEAKKPKMKTAPLGDDLVASHHPPEIVLARELRQVMEVALKRLPSELREVVILRDMEQLGYAEIAQITNCPLGTVKSRLYAARDRLRAVAQEWLEAE